MTEKFEGIGKCGKPVKGSIWRNGGSIKCHSMGITHYPKPDSKKELIELLCFMCNEVSKNEY